MKRYKDQLKERVKEIATNRKMKDLSNKKTKVNVGKGTSEPSFSYSKGRPRDMVLPGNKQFQKNDRIEKPQSSSGDGGSKASKDGEGEDDFSFTLTKEEFMNLYFEDMELPYLVKEKLNKEIKYKWVTGGYCKEGIPPRLSIKKTFEQAISRRIANKREDYKPVYLDEDDLRYIRKSKVPQPIHKAVMVCIMDVSYSMSENEKSLAKQFFFLLYMFLTKFYRDIDLVFVSFHSSAQEVSEEEFFYGQDTGGTYISEGIRLANKIVSERYDLNTTNVYSALASDGDVGSFEKEEVVEELTAYAKNLQYFSYLQIMRHESLQWHGTMEGYRNQTLYKLVQDVADTCSNIGLADACQSEDIYPALRELFKKRGMEK